MLFSRRTPAQSSFAAWPEGELKASYYQSRMLDAEGCPHGFLETHGMRLEFRRVCQRSDGLCADVKKNLIVPPLRRELRRKGNDQRPDPPCRKARRVSDLPVSFVESP